MGQAAEALRDVDRVAAVRRTGLQDSPREPAFDRIVALAALLLDVPYAFISITDDTRSFWKAQVGMPADVPQEVPAEASFCQYVVGERDELFVEDVAKHALTADNPALADIGVPGWAGAAIRSPSEHVIGSLCVGSPTVREWTERDAEVLRGLAAATSSQVAIADALEAERRARREADELAGALETVLLPATLTPLPGAAAAARHRTGSAGAPLLNLFYDVFVAADGAHYAILGEVSADGPGAATLTGLTRFTAQAASTWASGPAEILALVDETLSHQAPAGVLGSAAVVGVRRGAGGRVELRAASAGHVVPMLLRNGAAPERVGAPGPLLGLRGSPRITEQSLVLGDGEALALLADGATHAGVATDRRAELRAGGEADALARHALRLLSADHAAAALAIVPS